MKVSTDIFRQSRFIESSIDNVQNSLFEGAIFVVIILFLFLANVRTTLISLITLPLSLLVSILVLHYLGLTLNTMSLGGMAIAIGSLVDDAIVDVENVWKHLRENRQLPTAQRRPVIEVVFDARARCACRSSTRHSSSSSVSSRSSSSRAWRGACSSRWAWPSSWRSSPRQSWP